MNCYKSSDETTDDDNAISENPKEMLRKVEKQSKRVIDKERRERRRRQCNKLMLFYFTLNLYFTLALVAGIFYAFWWKNQIFDIIGCMRAGETRLPVNHQFQISPPSLTRKLIQMCGAHFQVDLEYVHLALEDKPFMRKVNGLLQFECALRDTSANTMANGRIVAAAQKASNITENVQSKDTISFTANETVEQQPNAPALKFADEATLFQRLSVMSRLNRSSLVNRFQQLTGYEVQYYLSKKASTFGIVGNLNFWEYFVQKLSDYQLCSLRRSTELVSDPKQIEDIFLFSDTRAARTNADSQFLLYDAQIVGPDFRQLSGAHKVTVVTQTSMNRLPAFIESYERWTGPISLGVFLKGPFEYFFFRSFISFLKRCHPAHYRQTSISIATPIEHPIPRNLLIETDTFDDFNCKSALSNIYVEFQGQQRETNTWPKTKYYPQNMMRNLARVNILTDYQITLDVDIVTSAKMSEGLNTFLNKSTIVNAMVIPTYEISRKTDFPQTKRELVSLTKKRLAQPFHREVYLPNQNATNFPKWERIHDSFEDVHVVHEIQQFPLHYEPFFVELNSTPLFDEGFLGYGFTRSSHAFEVFVQTGKFLVLSPIFTSQLGLKKMKEWSNFRQQQNERNRGRFDNFIRNITLSHPNVRKIDGTSNKISYYSLSEVNSTSFNSRN